MPTTPNQGLPYPANSAVPNVPADILALAQAAETRLNMRFADAAARDAAVASPVNGMSCYIDATKEYQLYSNLMWNTIWTGDFTSTVPRMSSLLSYQNRAVRPASTREGTLGLDRERNIIEAYNTSGTTPGWKHAGASSVRNELYAAFSFPTLFANSAGYTYTAGPSFSLSNASPTNIALSYTANVSFYAVVSGQSQLVNTYIEHLPPGANSTTGWVTNSGTMSTTRRDTLINEELYFFNSCTGKITVTGAGTYATRLYFQMGGGGPQLRVNRVNISVSPYISSTVFS